MEALVLDPAQCWLLRKETPDGGSEGLLSENAECAENAEIAETGLVDFNWSLNKQRPALFVHSAQNSPYTDVGHNHARSETNKKRDRDTNDVRCLYQCT